MDFAEIFKVAGILTPVFACVLAGALMRRFGFIDEALAAGLNKLMFWVALPCLITTSIAGGAKSANWGGTAAALAVTVLFMAVLSWISAPILGIRRESRGSFTQSVFRSNNAYVGIPVILSAFEKTPALREHAASVAILTLAPCLILYNVLAVIVLQKTGPNASTLVKIRKVASGVMKNPLIIASIAGSLILFLQIHIPEPVFNSARLIGEMSTPGALIALGASLTADRFRTSLAGAHAAAFLKLAVCPATGAAVSSLFGLAPVERFVVIAYLSCPTAVASFVMAKAMGGDAGLAGSTVALTTVYSVFSLALAILFAMPS